MFDFPELRSLLYSFPPQLAKLRISLFFRIPDGNPVIFFRKNVF